jgi:hypothetical protein
MMTVAVPNLDTTQERQGGTSGASGLFCWKWLEESGKIDNR